MKNLFLFIGAATAVAAYFLIAKAQQPSKPVPVADLAHKLQDAWADHHTVA